MAGKYVIFSLGSEVYGLPIQHVEQILDSAPITRIPKTSKEVLGVFNLRGQTLPVVDTRAVLGLPHGEFKCFVVLSVDGSRVAFSADRVDKIHEFAEGDIERTPEAANGQLNSYVGNDGNRLVTLIEPSSLLQGVQMGRQVIQAA